jgi:hypothetical protein
LIDFVAILSDSLITDLVLVASSLNMSDLVRSPLYAELPVKTVLPIKCGIPVPKPYERCVAVAERRGLTFVNRDEMIPQLKTLIEDYKLPADSIISRIATCVDFDENNCKVESWNGVVKYIGKQYNMAAFKFGSHYSVPGCYFVVSRGYVSDDVLASVSMAGRVSGSEATECPAVINVLVQDIPNGRVVLAVKVRPAQIAHRI